jgi:hypothetical protein
MKNIDGVQQVHLFHTQYRLLLLLVSSLLFILCYRTIYMALLLLKVGNCCILLYIAIFPSGSRHSWEVLAGLWNSNKKKRKKTSCFLSTLLNLKVISQHSRRQHTYRSREFLYSDLWCWSILFPHVIGVRMSKDKYS